METKVCATCGRELTLDHFAKKPYGIAKSCKECNGKKCADGNAYKKKVSELEKQIAESKAMRLKDFTPRELMEELAMRGYRGKLTYTQVQEIDLSRF